MGNKMIKLKDIINEFEYPKGKYVAPSASDLEDIKQTLFDLISNAYAPIGGHVKFKSPDDVKDPDLTYWMVADIDEDPEIDVAYFGKRTPFGIKHTGIGHDGERANIKNLLLRKTAELNTNGNYVEVSGASFTSFTKRGNVPMIDDEATVRKILGARRASQTTWHGSHPDGKQDGTGWYTRTVGGKQVTKIMLGKV